MLSSWDKKVLSVVSLLVTALISRNGIFSCLGFVLLSFSLFLFHVELQLCLNGYPVPFGLGILFLLPVLAPNTFQIKFGLDGSLLFPLFKCQLLPVRKNY